MGADSFRKQSVLIRLIRGICGLFSYTARQIALAHGFFQYIIAFSHAHAGALVQSRRAGQALCVDAQAGGAEAARIKGAECVPQ